MCQHTLGIVKALGDDAWEVLYRSLDGEAYYGQGCFHNLGIALYGLHRPPEAAEAYQKALTIRRRSAMEQPQTYEPNMVMTLDNLG